MLLSNYCRPASRPPNRLSGRSFGQEIDRHPMTPTKMQATDQELDEETPAEVALLLTSLRDISSKEIKSDPPIISALADAFLCFPDLESAQDVPAQEGQQSFMRTAESTLARVQPDLKKARSISLDSPEMYSIEMDYPLLQWRNIRGESTSPPLGHSTDSAPPSSQVKRRSLRVRLLPKNKRPRAVSCAEAKDVASLDATRVKCESGKKMKLILRKKFSWKNYPEVSAVSAC